MTFLVTEPLMLHMLTVFPSSPPLSVLIIWLSRLPGITRFSYDFLVAHREGLTKPFRAVYPLGMREAHSGIEHLTNSVAMTENKELLHGGGETP